MLTGAFVADRSLDQDEVRRGPHRHYLAGRGDADQQPATGNKEPLCHQHGERCAYGKADNSQGNAAMFRRVHLGMVAGPTRGTPRQPGTAQTTNDIAVGVQNADGRNWLIRQTAPTTRLAQQVLRPKTPTERRMPFPSSVPQSTAGWL